MKKNAFRVKKGEFDYIGQKKLTSMLVTIGMYGISLGIFLGGYFYHGRDVKNILTLVAVLGFLPASKSLVSTIMFLRARGCSAGLKEQVLLSGENFNHYFDFYFTSYARNYPISHMVLIHQVLYGITEWEKCDCQECEKHLMSYLKREGIRDIAVKIMSEADQYCEKLAKLHYEYDSVKGEDDQGLEDTVFGVMKAISL